MAATSSRRLPLTITISALLICAFLSSWTTAAMASLEDLDPTKLFYNGTGCLRVPAIPNIGYCGVPYKLSNFQGLMACSQKTAMARPRDIAEVARLVKSYSRVKAVGTGLSWNKEEFCAGPDATSLNIAMTEIDSLEQLFTKHPWDWDVTSPDFPVQVDATAGTVTVAAGVPLRTLLNLLALPEFLKKKCRITKTGDLPLCGQGHFLKMIPQILEITIGGGVATSTHGSSTQKTTLSSQVLAMEVVLANGSVKTFTRKDDTHLMRALRTNVGQLGVVTKLTLEIIPQPVLTRARWEITAAEAVARVKKVSDAYSRAKAASPSGVDLKDVVKKARFNDFLILWFMVESDRSFFVDVPTVWWIETSVNSSSPVSSFPEEFVKAADMQALQSSCHVTGSQTAPPNGLVQSEVAAIPKSAILACSLPGCPNVVAGGFKAIVDGGLSNTTTPAIFAYPTTRPEWFALWANIGRTREYEVCTPLESAGAAMAEVLEYLKSNPLARGSFRTPTGFRLVAEDDAYLSAGNGGPRICMEIDDFVEPNVDDERRNKPVEDIVAIFMKRSGRMHWGKFGWPKFEPCFDGFKKWGGSWCQFGCAKMALDPPPHKFQSENTFWKWFATKNGAPVADFGQCCSPSGFSTSCSCASRPTTTCSTASPMRDEL